MADSHRWPLGRSRPSRRRSRRRSAGEGGSGRGGPRTREKRQSPALGSPLTATPLARPAGTVPPLLGPGPAGTRWSRRRGIARRPPRTLGALVGPLN